MPAAPATSLQLLSATAPPLPLPFPRCKCYGSSCWVVQATTRSAAAAAARGSGWNSHGWRTRLGSKMDLRMPHLVDTAPFCSVVQAPSSPSSHGHANTVHHPVTVPMSFFGYGKAKVPDVVQAGDPVLHEPAEEVKKEDIGSVHIEKTINDMVATMRNAPGVGLAAPQIGVPLQIIVLEDTTELMSYTSVEECEAQHRYPFDLLVIINPKLTKKANSGSAFFFEGCLSVEGYRALVERCFEVEVSGLGRDGQPITVTAKGWKARILQHECDHLQGILYVDRMVPRSFRTTQNLRLPLPAGCPRPGICMSQFCT
ncbi:hypothetical protein BDL97_02G058400 [Sphagnum fallax]|nr:hypothetical protein BDL97_02G058400 [Sphagnum fallax]